MSQDLLKQIDELVASKTFNLDALDGIKKLKDDLSKQLIETEMLRGQVEKHLRHIEQLNDNNKALHNKNEVLNIQLKANEEKAVKGQEAIYEAEKYKAVAEAWQGAMQTVFKPNTVRETVFQSIPISQTYGGNTTVMGYQQETKTTKEEL